MANSISYNFIATQNFDGLSKIINKSLKKIDRDISKLKKKFEKFNTTLALTNKKLKKVASDFKKTAASGVKLTPSVSAQKTDLGTGKGASQLSAKIDKLNKRLAKTPPLLRKIRSESSKAGIGLKKLGSTKGIAGLKNRLQKTNSAVKKISPSLKQAAKAADKLGRSSSKTAPKVDKLGDSVEKTTRKAKRFRSEFAKASKFGGDFGKRAKKVSRQAQSTSGAIGSFVPILAAVGLSATSILFPIKKAIEFESAMADVRKVVDFKAPDGLKVLGDDLIKLSKTIPVSAVGLAEIAASGGRLGIAEKDIKKFVETTAKIAVALELAPEAAGDAMAKLSGIFQIPISEIEKLGDVINFTADNSKAFGEQIIRALKNKGAQAGKQLGLTTNQTVALADTFISLGINADRVGSVMENMTRNLFDVSKVGPEIVKKFAIDPQGTLIDVLAKLKGVTDKAKRIEVLTKIFGEMGLRVGLLVDNLVEYKRIIKVATDETGFANSVNREFGIRSETTKNKLILLSNSFSALGRNIGKEFLPGLNRTIARLVSLIDGFDALLTKFPIIIKAFVTLSSILIKLAALFAFKKLGSLIINFGLLAVKSKTLRGVLSPLAGVTRKAAGGFGFLAKKGLSPVTKKVPFMGKLFGGLGKTFGSVGKVILRFIPGLNLIFAALLGFDIIKFIIKDVLGFGDVWDAVISFIVDKFKLFLKFMANSFGRFKSFLGGIRDAFKNVFDFITGKLVSLAKAALSVRILIPIETEKKLEKFIEKFDTIEEKKEAIQKTSASLVANLSESKKVQPGAGSLPNLTAPGFTKRPEAGITSVIDAGKPQESRAKIDVNIIDPGKNVKSVASQTSDDFTKVNLGANLNLAAL